MPTNTSHSSLDSSSTSTSLPSKSKKNYQKMSSGRVFSLPVPNAVPKAGESLPRRHPLVVHDSHLPENLDAPVASVLEIFQQTVRRIPNKEFLGTRSLDEASGKFGPYQWTTYEQASEIIDNLGSALSGLGMVKGDRVGLFSANRAEWLLSEYACFRMSYITVPLYDTLGEESIQHIVNQAELSAIVATQDKAALLVKLSKNLTSLKRIILMDKMSESLKIQAQNSGIILHLLSDLVSSGKKTPINACLPGLKDTATICYTSGTTGLPKGAVLPHSAFIATLVGIKKLVDGRLIVDLNENEVHLSYLPYAHIFERALTVCLIYFGASIGFYQGNMLKILEDVGELKPTLFVSVPRIYNRIYDRVMAGVKEKSGLAQTLFNYAYSTKIKALQSNGILSHWLWDRLVFGAIRNRLGGRVRAMVTGAAPISPTVMDFLRIAFSCEVYEGYGQTETCAASCLTEMFDYSTGILGGPAPHNEIKLVDVPEMQYFTANTPPRGEICFRGANCFTEYYKEPEKTAEAIDADGWVHTGDIGEFDSQGRIKIIDRKKNIFKLAQGEYIAPEKIENILLQNSFIEQIFLYGDSLQSTVVAVIVPSKDAVIAWSKENLKGEQSSESSSSIDDQFNSILNTNKNELSSHLLAEMSTFARKSGLLKGFEIPKAIFIERNPFTVENNLLTSSFKLKRFEASKYYRDQIREMYQSMVAN